MIRRKIWATATFCLAVAGTAQAQTGAAPKASLGAPKTDYIARGVAPNSGYPVYVPRNYVAPTPPGYSPTSAPIGPATSGVVSSPAELFAVEADGPAPGTPGTPMPIPAAPMGTPTPMPMTGGATPVPAAPSATLVEQGPYNPMIAPTISGGPMAEAPFLDGTGYYGDSMPGVWATGEFLGMKFKGVKVPALVSTAPAGSPGTIDDANTFVTYGGGDDILNDLQSGYRVRAGFWLPDGSGGIDLGYFWAGTNKERTQVGSNGDQGLFRPFFNSAIAAEDAQLIAFTDPVGGPLFAGRIGTQADATLWGFEANYRSGIGMGFGGRLDVLVGYRYINLRDRLQIQSQATTLVDLGPAPAGTQILTDDRFEAYNVFNGGQVGLVGEWMLGNMTFGMRGTVAVGSNAQRVEIAGITQSMTPAGTAVTSPGGLLALPSNMSNFTRNRVSIVPEVGITLGYQVTNNIRVFGGLNGMYWTNTVRAGEQINRNVNATMVADPLTGVRSPNGALAPTFHFRDENFYAYGYSLGLEFRW